MTSKIEYESIETCSYRFSSMDTIARNYLDEYGFVVIGNVLNDEEIKQSFNLLWNFLENLGWKRNDISTWKNRVFPGLSSSGLCRKLGIGQSDFQWYIRTRQSILNVFANLWQVETSELLTSMDGCGIFRPWYNNSVWKTKKSWFHVDQNPKIITQKACIQVSILVFFFLLFN